MAYDYPAAYASSKAYPLGSLIDDTGKTKVLYEVRGKPGFVIMSSLDALTAGDGARRVELLGKGELANQTTCNTFEFLKRCKVPMAYVQKDTASSFIARRCRMLPFEVVVRGMAYGSYLKRNPGYQPKDLLDPPLVEFYLKTKDKRWGTYPLPCDDPLFLPDPRGEQYCLYRPNVPIHEQDDYAMLDPDEVFTDPRDAELLPDMTSYAESVFGALEWAWKELGLELIDLKVEFGIDAEGDLLLADVIDNDSWRLLYKGEHVDKQLFRDGRPLDEVERAYRFVAEMSDRLPALA